MFHKMIFHFHSKVNFADGGREEREDQQEEQHGRTESNQLDAF